jgi:hypothetical protein
LRETTDSLQEIDQLLDALAQASEVLSRPEIKAFNLPPQQELVIWTKQLEQQRFHSGQRFTMMVLGEFNSGKSTLLSAVLDLPKELQLPTSYDPTTAKPVRLTYKKGSPEACWLMKDGSKVSKPWKEALEAADQTADHTAVMKDVQEVHLLLEHHFLYHADILDMPGTGTAEFKEHTYLTREYLNNVEMIIWVIGAHEPSRVGKRDFIEARRAGVPITVVFNAWGVLDEEEDNEVGIDQDQFEADVRRNFQEAFQNESAVFRVYARKCLEARDAGLKLPTEFGLAAFREYLAQNYLNEFVDRRHNSRLLARDKAIRIAQSALPVLEDAQQRWTDKREEQGAEDADIRALEAQARRLSSQIHDKINSLAEIRSKEIISYLRSNTERFLTDNISATNLQLVRGAVDKKHLEEYLATELRKKYLHLDQPGNWLEDLVEEFLQRCWVIAEAEWSRFLDTISVSLPRTSRHSIGQKIQIPFDEIQRAVQATMKNALSQIITGLATIGVLVATSAATVIGLALVIVAAPIFARQFEKTRDNAIKSVRLEMEIQQVGLARDLATLAMDVTHKKLRESFDRLIAQRRRNYSEKDGLLKEGIEAIAQLRQDFAAVNIPAA